MHPRIRGCFERYRRVGPLGLAVVGMLTVSSADGRSADGSGSIDFQRAVRPILAAHCYACHGPDAEAREAGLRLDRREDAIRELESGATAIVPGAPDESELLARLTHEDESLRMPPRAAGPRLEPSEIEVLRRWIAEGAPYEPHWAFTRPVRRPSPDVNQTQWPRDPLDRWILARLEAEGLKPSPEADRYTLLRRVSLDLRGLPPSPEEIQAFVDDASPDAYERAVDRFLADEAYGERMARIWLDLARYADSSGFGSDPLRPQMYRFRDWVIDAFNRNLPYDQFTIEQIAGDLLDHPTADQRLATAFHRNTMTNTEGGTDDEEFRVAAVKDRVDVTFQVWMGLTMGCAKCHSHKYDPLTNEEYYQAFAIFNQTADTDQPDERPTMPSPTPALRDAHARIDAAVAALRAKLEAPSEALARGQAAWEQSARRRSRWRVIDRLSASSESGATFVRRDDGSWLVQGPNPVQDVYTLRTRVEPGSTIAAIRLEALPDDSLPSNGPGRAPDGNFVLSKLTLEVSGGVEAQPAARFVRVEIPGDGKILSLAEVEVESGGRNVARDGTASQSSTDYDGPAALAIDGQTDGDYFRSRSVTHTRIESSPWWEVRLPETTAIDRVRLWNRTDGDLQPRLQGARVQLLDDDRKVVWQEELDEAPRSSVSLVPTTARPLAVAKAAASFAQERFPAASAIGGRAGRRGNRGENAGWAIGPKHGTAHVAVFALEKPLAVEEPTALTLRLDHQYKESGGGFTLGRFRLAVADDTLDLSWLELPVEVREALELEPESRSDAQRSALANHYRSIAPELKPIRDEIAALEKSRPEIPNVPVMEELPLDKRRVTHVMRKGNYLDLGPTVEPGFPAAFHPAAADLPRNRLGLARWLVDPANPLTARVAVNRLWSQFFGVGLVETEEDFGTQGELPTHPELLDALAVDFQESGWDIKRLVRRLVTSATYRQSSKVTPELLAIDPKNRLLARSPRYRLEAETIRDQALALSGLLSRKVGGPSVYPPQPDGLWQAAFNGQRTWPTSQGEDRYRRGLYTFWRRTVPYPSMAAFDAPSREVCAVRRVRTNTPLQAFVTLNDPVYVEAAQALARRLVAEGGPTTVAKIRYGLLLCLGRPATPEQVGPLLKLFASELARYLDDPEAATAMATEPLGPLPEGLEPAEMAAWTAVANVLLNLDGVLSRS